MECSTNELTAAFCGCRSEAGGDRAPVTTSSRPRRSNGGRRHASNPTATGSPTATARAAVSRATVADDAAESATMTETAPIAIAGADSDDELTPGAAHRRPILH